MNDTQRLQPLKTMVNYMDAILVFEWRKAPNALRALSEHGGDEDWVAVLPAHTLKPIWMDEGGAFGCCSVSEHDIGGGVVVCIGAHA